MTSATVGNVTSPRPGIFDMLGRAKWDAWAKHKDLDQYEAKWLYVDALLKALSKYSDKTVAKDLIDELGVIWRGSWKSRFESTESRDSSSSGSAASEDHPRIPQAFPQYQDLHAPAYRHFDSDADADAESSADGEIGDEARDLPAVRDASQQPRPLSSLSLSSRYGTPVIGSFTASSLPPRRASVTPIQPLPNYETPSAFADPQSATSIPSSVYPTAASYAGRYPSPSRDLAPRIQSATPHYRGQPTPLRHYSAAGGSVRPPSRSLSTSLEHAVENAQAHLAALTERIDSLESSLASQPHPQRSTSSRPSSGRGSPADPSLVPQDLDWDMDDMGLWSLVLKPLLRGLSSLQRLLLFFLRSEQNRSPVLIVVRRLFLDISFVFAVLGFLRVVWRTSRVRRREVGAALVVLWGAVTGRKGRGIPVGSLRNAVGRY
ncbi:ACBP-domain-containing protein [Melanogaster broomeanus]|nr:ACBP-domain-containing protein [Melanogaster broomeanus]